MLYDFDHKNFDFKIKLKDLYVFDYPSPSPQKIKKQLNNQSKIKKNRKIIQTKKYKKSCKLKS
jgi:hypothetical protein